MVERLQVYVCLRHFGVIIVSLNLIQKLLQYMEVMQGGEEGEWALRKSRG